MLKITTYYGEYACNYINPFFDKNYIELCSIGDNNTRKLSIDTITKIEAINYIPSTLDFKIV